MKRFISMLLAMVMLLSAVPMIGFAEENEEITQAEENEVDTSKIGIEAELGNTLYYIEDGNLLCSVDSARPKTVAEGVKWVVEDNGFVYYAKIEENNTDIYKSGDDGFQKLTRLFVPIDCFDVDGDWVYYLWNGEIDKVNVLSNEDVFVQMFDGDGFWVDAKQIFRLINSNNENNDNMIFLQGSYGIDDKSHTATYRGLTLPLSNYLPGSYFTKNGGQCGSCHGRGTCLSASDCNCYNFHGMTQCLGFANYVLEQCFGTYASNSFNRLSGENVKFASEKELKDIFMSKVTLGSHIRTGGNDSCSPYHHSLVYMDSDDNYIWTYEGNSDGKCGVHVVKRSWSELSSYLTSTKPGISYIEVPYADMYPGEKVDTSTKGQFEPDNPNEDLGSIPVVSNIDKPKSSAKTILKGVFNNLIKSTVKSIVNNIITDVKNKITGDIEKVVTVYGTVKNKAGEVYYKLADELYVLKSDFDKKFKKKDKNTYTAANPAAGIISFSNMNEPDGSVKYKNSFSLRGNISSTANITSIKGEVINSATEKTELSSIVNPYVMNYSIYNSALDRGIKFANLRLNNTYYIKYTVKDSSGSSKEWYSNNFSVVTAGTTPAPSIWPESLEYGQRIVISAPGASIYTSSDYGNSSGWDSLCLDFTTPGTHNVSAYAIASGKQQSGTSYGSVYVSKCAAPSISDAQFNASDATVTLSGSGNIYYTLDGSTPTKWSSLYTGPIHLTNSATVKAISAQWGCVTSDVVEKWENISPPDAPTVTLNTKDKLAQGKTTSISWNPAARATSYTAYMMKGDCVYKQVTTTGTTASFILDERSDTENFEYKIKVVANNFKGNSPDSNNVTVWGMHPLKVTFVDRITRTGELTEEKLNEVKRKVDNRYGETMLEGNVISVQKVDYDEMPSKPSTPSKTGFTFSGWSSGLYEVTLLDKTVYGDFDINYYNVTFYDVDNDNKRMDNALSSEKYMYTDEAVLPDNYDLPSGYIFEGWNIDNTKSTGFDLSFVDGNIIADAVYGWANKNLKQYAEITEITRSTKSYDVTVSIKNCPFEDSQGRIIVSLYTSDGRNVYTQISENDLDAGGLREYTGTKTVTLNYDGKISYAKAFVVGVKQDKTGGAMSLEAMSSDITYNYADFWTNWSAYKTADEWKAEGIDVNETSSGFEVKSKSQYRYRNRTYRESNSSAANGWEHYDTRITGYGGTQGPVYYNPSGYSRNVWSEPYYISSNYKNVYRYYRIADSEHALWGASYWAYKYRYNYQFDSPLTLKPGDSYSYYLPCSCSTLTSRNDWFHTVYSVDHLGEAYPATVWVSDNYGTRWYYQDPIYTYYFRSWGNWSNWSDSRQSGDETQSRTVYSYRKLTTDDNETEVENGFIYDTEDALPDMGTEYITEEEFNKGNNRLVSGPYYIKDEDAENESDKYILVEKSNHEVKEYRYGRFTNGSYTMPCKDCAEELYGGEWQTEWTDWSENQCDNINENIFSCENNPEHDHNTGKYDDGTDYWNEYVIDGESYCFAEERTVSKDITYSDKTKYYKVKTSLKGQVATVMIYKKTNTDPTQAQLEYVDQITIDEGNTYKIHANTKELIDSDTGDFIVTLALEGGMRLINVGVIPAKLQKHEVKFNVNGIEYKTEHVEHGKAVDINNFSIDDIEALYPGYEFVKWDKSVIDVTENMSVNAIMVPKKYVVAFVDYENQTTQLQALSYGESIPNPVVEPIEGKRFIGWNTSTEAYIAIANDVEVDTTVEKYYLLDDGETYIKVSDYDRTKHSLSGETIYIKTEKTATVTGNMIVEAVWETNTYNVKFVDLDGNAVSEQSVKYGESAELPEFITKDGITYTWSLTGAKWWNVTEDMTVYPYDTTETTVAAPIIDASTDEVGGTFYASLSAADDESKVYYTTDVEITNEDAKNFASIVTDEEAIYNEGEPSLMSEITDAVVSLFSNDEEQYEDYQEYENYSESPIEYIKEYTEPIQITEGTVVYAFTVDKDGKISPIAVYSYGYDDSVDDGIIENTYEIDPDCPQITLPNLSVKPNETVTVPVSIKNNPGLTNLSLLFGYDAENLELVKAENGDVFRNTEFSPDIRDDGSCKFTWLAKSENTTNGTLLYLTFKTNDNGGKYNISMDIEEAVSPNEEEQPFATQDGKISNIGTLSFGDVTGDGDTTFADAILIMRADVGFATLTDTQKKKGDVNGDGDVDFADAVMILKFDAGLLNLFK